MSFKQLASQTSTEAFADTNLFGQLVKAKNRNEQIKIALKALKNIDLQIYSVQQSYPFFAPSILEARERWLEILFVELAPNYQCEPSSPILETFSNFTNDAIFSPKSAGVRFLPKSCSSSNILSRTQSQPVRQHSNDPEVTSVFNRSRSDNTHSCAFFNHKHHIPTPTVMGAFGQKTPTMLQRAR